MSLAISAQTAPWAVVGAAAADGSGLVLLDLPP
jgi:hypothetical protein